MRSSQILQHSMDAASTSPVRHIDAAVERAVRRFLAAITGRYDVAGAILYGSRARGDHDQDSDADLAVLLNGEPGKYWAVQRDMCNAAHDIMLETDVFLSPLPIWLYQWEQPSRHPNPGLLYSIEQEGIRL